MAFDKDFFSFLSRTETPIHNEEPLKIALLRAADNKAYSAMQSEYANCMVKLKSFDQVVDRTCLHVNVEEKWSVQLSKKFDYFHLISQLL